jgi:AraC-like DNA-binding protein
MPLAPNRRPLPPSAPRDKEQQHYREELIRLAEVRHLAEAQAAQAKADTARILPQSLAFGVSLADVATITEFSRTTLYRMLDEATKLQNLRGLLEELETAIHQITLELGRPALPSDLAEQRGVTTHEAHYELTLVLRLLRDDLVTFHQYGQAAITNPQVRLAPPEHKILKMLIEQGKSKKKIATATGLTEGEVTARASLALLRLIPSLRPEKLPLTKC